MRRGGRGWLAGAPGSLLMLVLLALATAFAFGPALDNQFVWDTLAYLQLAPGFELSWAFVAWAFRALELSNWHPLTWISWAVDAELYDGLQYRGFHLTNLVLHALVAFVFFRFALTVVRVAEPERRGGPGREAYVLACALAALLWCVHPQRVEVVAWVAQRKDLLCTLFMLLTAIAWLNARSRSSAGWYALALAAYVLAVLAKPMAVIVPPLLLLLAFYPLRPPRRAAEYLQLLVATAPFWALGLALAWVTMLAQQDTISGNVGTGLGTRIAHAFTQTVVYVQKTVLPLRLSPFYPFPVPLEIGAQGIAAIFAVVAASLGTLALALRGGRFGPAVAWFAFLVCLVPVIGLVKVGMQAGADRYSYVAALPLMLGAALLLARSATTRTRRITLVAAPLALTLLFATLARDYTRVWHDRGTLWDHAAAMYPDSHMIQLNRASAQWALGNLAAADAAFEAARRADGFRYQPGHLVHWGYVKMLLGSYEEAIEVLTAARELDLLPDCTDYNIAWNLARLGRDEEALARLERFAGPDTDPDLLLIVGRLRGAITDPATHGPPADVPYCNDLVAIAQVTSRTLGED